ncbi:MAG: hypothetical protein GY753_03440 [Gammaproteobacteria bacterium]|nr:hypothetical protein [Gammaproteobacteria bacterium]
MTISILVDKMRKMGPLFLLASLAVLLLPQLSHADNAEMAALIDKADNQRMLSQRIAKNYFFLRQNIRPKTARAQLSTSMEKFASQHEDLKSVITKKDHKEVLEEVDLDFEDFNKLLEKPYSLHFGYQLLYLSEIMLESYQYILDELGKESSLQYQNLIDISGRLSMQSQRIAKFYIAYQSGFQDPIMIKDLRDAVDDFEHSHKLLIDAKQNTPEIKVNLGRVKRLWRIVYNFFLELEDGQLPVTVSATTDGITVKMDEITRMYEALALADSNQQ